MIYLLGWITWGGATSTTVMMSGASVVPGCHQDLRKGGKLLE